MSTATSKGFKIRKPSSRRMTPDDIADREEVMRLEDLRMADIENPVRKDTQKCNKSSQHRILDRVVAQEVIRWK